MVSDLHCPALMGDRYCFVFWYHDFYFYLILKKPPFWYDFTGLARFFERYLLLFVFLCALKRLHTFDHRLGAVTAIPCENSRRICCLCTSTHKNIQLATIRDICDSTAGVDAAHQVHTDNRHIGRRDVCKKRSLLPSPPPKLTTAVLILKTTLSIFLKISSYFFFYRPNTVATSTIIP